MAAYIQNETWGWWIMTEKIIKIPRSKRIKIMKIESINENLPESYGSPKKMSRSPSLKNIRRDEFLSENFEFQNNSSFSSICTPNSDLSILGVVKEIINFSKWTLHGAYISSLFKLPLFHYKDNN